MDIALYGTWYTDIYVRPTQISDQFSSSAEIQGAGARVV